MSSNVLQPNPPHNTKIISPLSAQTALLQPPKKNHIFINVSKDHFSRFMWAFLGLSWSDFHRENRKQELSLSLPPLLFPSFLFYISLYLCLYLYRYTFLALPLLLFLLLPFSPYPHLSSPLLPSRDSSILACGLWFFFVISCRKR